MNKMYLSKAYTIYQNVLGIIDRITDSAYISASEIVALLNTILGSNILKPQHINYLLLDHHIIFRNKTSHKIQTANKFIINPKYLKDCKELQTPNYSFYIWNMEIIWTILNLNFNTLVNINDLYKFCNILKRYVHINFNYTKVFNNLIYLQLILINSNYVHI